MIAFMKASDYETYMHVALEEAKKSLRGGNNGFGAAIIKNGVIIALTHDTEETDTDPTAHAEMKAIGKAARITGKNLHGCTLISTHEPCPMCSFALVWSGISTLVYGYSIDDAIKQGRNRIAFGCEDAFARSGKPIEIVKGILWDECSLLYRKDVRDEIKKLRNASDSQLEACNRASAEKRAAWFRETSTNVSSGYKDPKEAAYHLLLKRFGITEKEAPVVEHSSDRIVFHSQNFCPTLEACKILDIDTRFVCRHYNEKSTDSLIKLIDSGLRFERNYEKLRPYFPYCEEMILSADAP